MGISVQDMKKMLSAYPDDCVIYFSGLDFYRLKQRGDKLLQVEFDQFVYRDEKGHVFVDNIK